LRGDKIGHLSIMSFALVFSPSENSYRMRHHDKSSVCCNHEGCHTRFYDIITYFAYCENLRGGSVLFMTASKYLEKDPESASRDRVGEQERLPGQNSKGKLEQGHTEAQLVRHVLLRRTQALQMYAREVEQNGSEGLM
jgi:hypothetical protein